MNSWVYYDSLFLWVSASPMPQNAPRPSMMGLGFGRTSSAGTKLKMGSYLTVVALAMGGFLVTGVLFSVWSYQHKGVLFSVDGFFIVCLEFLFYFKLEPARDYISLWFCLNVTGTSIDLNKNSVLLSNYILHLPLFSLAVLYQHHII